MGDWRGVLMWVVLVAGWYVVAGGVTFLAYFRDKRASLRGGWRVRERTLHVMGVLGGWPGGMLGRRLLRHKTRRWRFTASLWGSAALHAAGWAGVLWVVAVR